MDVIIRSDAESAAHLTAQLIARAIEIKPNLVLGLATGRTMEAVYPRLARLNAQTGVSFAGVRTFNLDEYIGIPADHPGSYRRYMNEFLFSKVDIRMENTHLPNGMAADPNAECAAYEAAIRACDGIDFQLLGMGIDGHIGFNEALSSLQSRTRRIALAPSTIRQNAAMFGGDTAKVPRHAMTMGVGTILESRRCVLLVTGAAKAGVLAQAVEGPITAMISASALQLHPHCTVIVDEAAADGLKGKDYYRWIFENEPEWAGFR